MRLRVFEAATSQQALARMREVLGPDAVVVATRDTETGVCITAAVEARDPDLRDMLDPAPPNALLLRIEEALETHAVPQPLVERLLARVREAGLDDPQLALADALGELAGWAGSPAPAFEGVALLGPCGGGKTAAVAKLAAEARLAGRRPEVASLDTRRAGGVARLQNLLAPLGLEVRRCEDPRMLSEPVTDEAPRIVDTGGINPFSGRELAALADLLPHLRQEPVLVLPAGLDPADSGEIAANFAALGVGRMIVTKLDMARRFGGLLTALEAGLRPARVSIGPAVGSRLLPLTPASLARLLLGGTQAVAETSR